MRPCCGAWFGYLLYIECLHSEFRFVDGGLYAMAIEVAELNRMQNRYHSAVEDWIAAIRKEEVLASVNHSEAEIDTWEGACFAEENAREEAKAAKKAYEDALREEFFNF